MAKAPLLALLQRPMRFEITKYVDWINKQTKKKKKKKRTSIARKHKT
jgi:hypothetical protein